jgi:putative endonuclease
VGERIATAYLQRLGYSILARNYRCRGGEIDLVAADGPVVVFVEVKTRRRTEWGGPLEAVDARKRRRMAMAASHFLLARWRGEPAVRFDVIGILWRAGTPDVEHVMNAFDVD